MSLLSESPKRLTWNDEEEQPASRQTGTKLEQLCGSAAAVNKICLAFMARFGLKALHLVYADKKMIYQPISYISTNSTVTLGSNTK